MNYGFQNNIRVYYGVDQSGSSVEKTRPTTPSEGSGSLNKEKQVSEKQELKSRTEELYQKFITAKSKLEAQAILFTYVEDLFAKNIRGEVSLNDSKMATNVRILELYTKDVFDEQGNKRVLEPKILGDIQRALEIRIIDDNARDFYAGSRENNGINTLLYPVTSVTLAKTLTEIITDKDTSAYNIAIHGGSPDQKLDQLEIYYSKNSPDISKEKFRIMIQVARNILINTYPGTELSKNTGDLLGMSSNQTIIPRKKIDFLGGNKSVASSSRLEEPDENDLRDQLILSALLQAGGDSKENNAVLGGADVLGEYKKINKESPETKKLLDAWSPENMYALFFLRMSEFIEDSSKASGPKAMVNAFRKGVIGSRLDTYPEIKKIYTSVFDKMTLFINSGVIESKQGKEAIQKIGRKFSEKGVGADRHLTGDMNDPEFISLKNEIEKSLATKDGGFGLDDNNSLKFYSLNKIRSIITKDTWDTGKSMAVKGYLNNDDDFGGINQIFTQQSEKDAFFVYYSNLGSDKKNQLISTDRQTAFDQYIRSNSSEMVNDYIAEKNIPGGDTAQNRGIPIDDLSLGLSEEEKTSITNLLKNAGYNENYIPLKEGQLDVSYLLKKITEGKQNPNYKATKADIDKIANLLSFFGTGLQKKREGIISDLKNNQDIGKDSIIQEIFSKLGIQKNSIESFSAILVEQTDAQLKTLYKKLLEQNPPATLETRKKVASLIQSEIQKRAIHAQIKSVNTLEEVAGKDLPKVFERVTNSITGAEDLGIIKKQINTSIRYIPADIIAKYGLPSTGEGYVQMKGIEDILKKILLDSSVDPTVKAHIQDIINQLAETAKQEKIIVQNSEEIRSMGYAQVIERFSAQYSVLQDIPPHRLTQYQQELGIIPGITQSGIPTDLASLESRTPYPASYFSEFQGLSHISKDTLITKTDSGFFIEIAATDTNKTYTIEGIKNTEELSEKMQDANTLAEMKAYSLISHIDLIHTLISQNLRLQSIQGLGNEFPQRKIQLISAVELLLGQESISGQSVQDRIKSISKDTNSSGIHQKLVKRGVFNDGGTRQFEVISSFILEKSIRAEKMTDSELVDTFIGTERKSYILTLTEKERADLIIAIQLGIKKFREIYGEINSRTIEQYRRALSDTLPNA